MDICPICLDHVSIVSSKSCYCKYKFHDKCLRVWLKRKKTCPMCRRCMRPMPSRRERLISRMRATWRREESSDDEPSDKDECDGYDLSPPSSDDDAQPTRQSYYEAAACSSCLHPFTVVGSNYRLCTGCGVSS
jgi:hypothetical protein